MKLLFKWLVCIIKKRHTYEYFKSRMSAPHQFGTHGFGRVAHCEKCRRIVFFAMKNKNEYKIQKKGKNKCK